MAGREPLRPTSDLQRKALDEAVTRYQEALTPDAVRYLAHVRGLTRQAVDIARLGVVSDPAPGHGAFEGFLAIPYLRHDGQAVSIRFRCISRECGVLYRPWQPGDSPEEHVGHGKYMSMEDEPARMYGIPVIHDAEDEIHVAEGEFDSLILRQIGLPAVAVPGASAWNGVYRRMLAGFSRVWVWGDPDDAGAKLINTICRSMRQAQGVQLRIGDVTQTYLIGGAEALYELIEEGSA